MNDVHSRFILKAGPANHKFILNNYKYMFLKRIRAAFKAFNLYLLFTFKFV